jgi:glycosyltransferase involved in cell wall biosynthesis
MNSVCMATFNGSPFIKQQILSILKQINADDELIISDDSSTDDTVAIVNSIPDERIKLFTSNLFHDPIKNFQNALRQSSGQVIFLSDQDDVWIDGKYLEMLDLIEQYDLVVSDSIIVDQHLKVLHPSFFKYFHSGQGLIKNMIKSSYYGSCMVFRSRVLEEALPFPDTKEIGHDLWIGLVAEMIGRVYFYSKPLLLYRRHSNTFTPMETGKSKRNKFQMIRGRVIMIKEVVKFYIKYRFSWKRV